MAAKKVKAAPVKRTPLARQGATTQKKPAKSVAGRTPTGGSKQAAKKARSAAQEKAPSAAKKRGPSAAAAYGGQVHAILAAQRGPSTYAPAAPRRLQLANLRKPRTPDALTPPEREQLGFVLKSRLAAHLADPENDTEVAELVDEAGSVAYHLYAWNYGVGYLFGDAGPEDLVAMGTQHYIELWHRDQRDVFWAVDDALARASPPFGQALSFGWRTDAEWVEAPAEKNERREWMVRFLHKRK